MRFDSDGELISDSRSYKRLLVCKGILLMLGPFAVSCCCVIFIASYWNNGIKLASAIKLRSEEALTLQLSFTRTAFRGFRLIGGKFHGDEKIASTYRKLSVDFLSDKKSASAEVEGIVNDCAELDRKLTLRVTSMDTESFSGTFERLSSYKNILDSALMVADRLQTWFAHERATFLSQLTDWNLKIGILYLMVACISLLLMIVLFWAGILFTRNFCGRLDRLSRIDFASDVVGTFSPSGLDELGLLEVTFLQAFRELDQEQQQRELLAQLIGKTLLEHACETMDIIDRLDAVLSGNDSIDVLARCRVTSMTAVTKIAQFCQDLLTLSDGRLLAQNLRLKLISTSALVEATFLQTAVIADRKHICLRNTCSDTCIPVDEITIGRVLANLVGNAVKFAPTGSIIEVADADDAEFRRISVIDQGRAIDPDKVQSLFMPFQRVGSSPGVDGFGLGLAICRQLVHAHGGTCGHSLRNEGGNEFWFTIPKEPIARRRESRERDNEFCHGIKSWRQTKMFRKLLPIMVASLISQAATVGWVCAQCNEVNGLVNNIAQPYLVLVNASSVWTSFFQSSFDTLMYFVFQKSVYGVEARKNLAFLQKAIDNCHVQERHWNDQFTNSPHHDRQYPLHDDIGHLEKGLNQLSDTLEQPIMFDDVDLAHRLSRSIELAEKTASNMEKRSVDSFLRLQDSIQAESDRLRQIIIEALLLLLCQAVVCTFLSYSLSSIISKRLKLLVEAAKSLPSRTVLQRPARIDDELDNVMDALAIASLQLKMLDQRRQQSASSLVHDLRLPLQNLRIAAELLGEMCSASKQPEVNATIAGTISSLGRDIELVEGLLMIYKLSDPILAPDYNQSLVSPAGVILEVLKDAAFVAETKGLFIELETDGQSDTELKVSLNEFTQFIRKLVSLAVAKCVQDSEIKVILYNSDSRNGELMRITYVRESSYQKDQIPMSLEEIVLAPDIYAAVDLFSCNKFCSVTKMNLQLFDGRESARHEIVVSRN